MLKQVVRKALDLSSAKNLINEGGYYLYATNDISVAKYAELMTATQAGVKPRDPQKQLGIYVLKLSLEDLLTNKYGPYKVIFKPPKGSLPLSVPFSAEEKVIQGTVPVTEEQFWFDLIEHQKQNKDKK